MGYELHSVKGSKGFPSYSARFLFEKTPPDGAGNRSELDGAYDWLGYSGQSSQESSLEVGSESSYSSYIGTGTRQERELREFSWVSSTFDSDATIKRGRLKLKVWRGDDWPMALEVPFSDAQGHVVAHKLPPSVSTHYANFN